MSREVPGYCDHCGHIVEDVASTTAALSALDGRTVNTEVVPRRPMTPRERAINAAVLVACACAALLAVWLIQVTDMDVAPIPSPGQMTDN